MNFFIYKHLHIKRWNTSISLERCDSSGSNSPPPPHGTDKSQMRYCLCYTIISCFIMFQNGGSWEKLSAQNSSYAWSRETPIQDLPFHFGADTFAWWDHPSRCVFWTHGFLCSTSSVFYTSCSLVYRNILFQRKTSGRFRVCSAVSCVRLAAFSTFWGW